MISRWSTRYLAQLLNLHPCVFGQFADGGFGRPDGHLARCRRRIVVIQAVQRTMGAARRSDGRAQSCRNVQGCLRGSDLARLVRELMQRGVGQPRRGGRVIRWSVGGRVGGRGLAVDVDLAGGRDSLRGGGRVRGGHLQGYDDGS